MLKKLREIYLIELGFLVSSLFLVIQLLMMGVPQPGWAWDLRPEIMTPHDIKITSIHPEKVFTRVIIMPVIMNGTEYNLPDDMANAITKAYNDALQQTLRETKVFALSQAEDAADFLLEMKILRRSGVARSGYHGTFILAEWSLKNKQTGSIVCKKDIGSANVQRAFGPMTRTARNSSELNSAANIKKGIEWLSRITVENK